MKAVLFSGLAALAVGQGTGQGLSKDTRAISAGLIDSTYEFNTAYLPVEEASDDCTDRSCECGTQARVALLTDYEHEMSQRLDPKMPAEEFKMHIERRRPGPPVSKGFGLHGVYAPGEDDLRKAQNGNMTQEEIEAVFAAKHTLKSWDEFLDYNTGLYTEDIDTFVTTLKDANVPYYSLSWEDGYDEYMSALITPPGTTWIIEVVGESWSAPDWFKAEAKKVGARFHFKDGMNPRRKRRAHGLGSTTYFTALWVSRAVSDLDEAETFLTNVFELRSTAFTKSSGTDANGNSYEMFEAQVSNLATTKFRMVQPANWNTASDGYSIDWWEQYNLAVNKKYMTAINCGWPLRGDDHSAFDFLEGQAPDMSAMVAAVEEMGSFCTDCKYPYFCKGSLHSTHCYFTTPWVYQLQVDGVYTDLPSEVSSDYPGDLCATYDEHCTSV